MDAGLYGIPGQNGHHAGRGAEAPRVHTDATLLVPEDAHHHLCRDAPCQGGQDKGAPRAEGDLRPQTKPLESVGGERVWHCHGPPGPHPVHSLTLLLLKQLLPSPEAGLGSLHAHGLLAQGEDLSEVKCALATPPALGLGMGPKLRVFG